MNITIAIAIWIFMIENMTAMVIPKKRHILVTITMITPKKYGKKPMKNVQRKTEMSLRLLYPLLEH